MPLYEYRCQACEERFEVLRRMGQDNAGVTCPSCGEGRVEREHSTFASGSAAACAPGARFT